MEGIDQKGILVGDLYRMKRKEDENMLDHIEQARSEVKEHVYRKRGGINKKRIDFF